MNWASSSYVLVAAAALPLWGCTVTIEPATRFEGSEVSESLTYTSGKDIVVSGDNGSIDVVQGSGDTVKVSFKPFILDKEDNQENATAHMENNLTFEATETADAFVLRADKKDGASSSLGADIVVTVPAGFNGDFSLDQGNGGTEVDLSGSAPTSIDVFSDNGSVDVWLGSFAPGEIFLDGAGDLYLSIPGEVNGTITAEAGSTGVVSDNAPASWAVAENGEAAKSYTLGDGTGGNLNLVGGFDVTIDAQ